MVSKLDTKPIVTSHLTSKHYKDKETLWVHHNGFTYTIPVSNKLYDETASSSGGGFKSLLLSELPGKILKIFVKEGDIVTATDPLVSMEAMKMEHSFKAGAPAKIKKIHVTEGLQVAQKTKLIELEAITATEA